MRRLAFAILGALSAGSWALTGTLLDNSGHPLADATVKLVNAAKQSTTDANGAFSFDLSAGLRNPGTSRASAVREPGLIGNEIHFGLDRELTANLRVLTPSGRQEASWNGVVGAGEHSLSIPACAPGLRIGLHLVRLEAGGICHTFRYLRYNTPFSAGPALLNGPGAARAASVGAAGLDTLVITKTIAEVTSQRKVLVRGYDDDINTYQADGHQVLILDPSNDNDGDGLTNFEERYVYHTNAELFDTDGDGVGDGQEVQDGRDPLVADFPSLSFSMQSLPIIRAHLSRSVDNSNNRDISTGGDYSNASSFTSESQVNASLEVALMVGAEYNFAADGGATIKGELTTTVGAGYSQTWTDEQSSSMSRNWNQTVSTATSNNVTIDGGEILVDVRLVNNSSQDVTLVDPVLRLTERGFESSTIGTVIGELRTGGNSEVYISSKPGANFTTAQFGATISNPDILEQIARYASGLAAQLTNIRFKVAGGEIDTVMSNVYRRTAEVIVDPGAYSSTPMVKKRVVTRNRYNDFYTSYTDRYQPATMDDVVRRAGVSPVLDSTDGRFGVRSVWGLANGAFQGGAWSGLVQSTTDSVRVFSSSYAGYDPRAIQVGGAGVVSLVYSADEDGDGLPGRLEAMLGTGDHDPDSDSDGVSDGAEYFGWRRPTDAPTALWKTDPRRRDTDGDGIPDSADVDPLTPAIDARDSSVTFSSIKLASLQGTDWEYGAALPDPSSTLSVANVMRGPARLVLEFSHPVARVRIRRTGSADTLVLLSPDQGTMARYSTGVPLVLGANQLEVQVVSRSGTATKTVLLDGIQRRLARATAAQFSVLPPTNEKIHMARDLQIGWNAIRALDPLIRKVVVVRTQVWGVPMSDADAAAVVQANDLGDAGDGQVNLAAGSPTTGKDGSKNTYAVFGIYDLSSTNLPANPEDTSLRRDSNYVYFPYVLNQDSGRVFLAAPNMSGTVQKPDRTVVVDSMTAGVSSWNLSWNTVTLVKIQVAGTDIVQFGWGTKNPDFGNSRKIDAGTATGIGAAVGHSFVEGDGIQFPTTSIDGVQGNFLRKLLILGYESGDWYSDGSLPSTVQWYQLLHPERCATDFPGWNWSTGRGFAFSQDIYNAGTRLVTTDFHVIWHYKTGPTP